MSEIELIKEDDVINTLGDIKPYGSETLTGSQLLAQIKSSSSLKVLVEGVSCRCLSPGGKWRKGKLKVMVGFEPQSTTEEADQ